VTCHFNVTLKLGLLDCCQHKKMAYNLKTLHASISLTENHLNLSKIQVKIKVLQLQM